VENPSYEELWSRLGKALEEVDALRNRVAELEVKLADSERKGKRQAAPFRREEDQRKPASEHKKAGRKPGHSGSRKEPPPPEAVSRVETVRLSGCPCCGGIEIEQLSTHEHFVVDVPQVKAQWTKFITESGFCKNCKKRVCSKHPEMPSNAVGAAGVSFGHGIVALTGFLRTMTGMSFRKIECLLGQWFDLSVSQSGLQKSLGRLELAMIPTHQAIAEGIKASKAVHIDETGWYVAGESYWAWVATTANLTLYKIRRSRGHEVALELIGEAYEGCLHSDFLGVYAPIKCRKAKCCFHLLTTMKKFLIAWGPTRSARRRYILDLKGIIDDSISLWNARVRCPEDIYGQQRQRILQRFEDFLTRRSRDPDCARLGRRLRRYRDDILRFLIDVDADPTNATAERALRGLVIARKLSAGNRSERGADRTAILYSVYATLRQRGANIVESLLDLLWGRTRNLIAATS
jgi:transposase